MDSLPNFWRWFFFAKSGEKSGWRGLIDGWLTLHVGFGCLSFFITGDLGSHAEKVIFPILGVLIGVTFAWSGNITALLSTRELSLISDISGYEIHEYVFTVQRAILVVFVTIIAWCLVALSENDSPITRFVCYTMSSYSVRESWQVILFAQYMTIVRKKTEDIVARKRSAKRTVVRKHFSKRY